MFKNWLALTNPYTAMDEFFDAPFFTDDHSGSFGTDITDEGDAYQLTADLPGFDKKDIKVQVQNNTVSVSAERHSEAEDKDKKDKFLRQERSYGSYRRTFTVGSDVDKANIKAKYEDGVLTVTLPKIAEPEEKDSYVTVE